MGKKGSFRIQKWPIAFFGFFLTHFFKWFNSDWPKPKISTCELFWFFIFTCNCLLVGLKQNLACPIEHPNFEHTTLAPA